MGKWIRNIAGAILAATLCIATAAAADIEVKDFLEPDLFRQLKISPDGEHYGATVPLEDRTVLVILRRADLKRTGYVMLPAEQHVTGFAWANNRTLVYTAAVQSGPLAVPQGNGFLYRVEADGSGNRRIGDRHLSLLDALPADPGHILVYHSAANGRDPVSRLNLETERIEREPFKDSPLRYSTYHIDNADEIRFASGRAFEELTTQLHQRDDAGNWHRVNVEKDSGEVIYVQGFSADNRTAYFIVEQAEGPDGFFAYDMQTRQRRLVARHPRVDVGRVLYSPLDGGVIALEYHDGPPSLEIITPDDPFVRELQKVVRAFPGSYVTPTSYTLDGKAGVYQVSSDVNSGEFYRVDHATGEATYVAARNERLDPERMAPMRSIRFKARDGLEIQGFLTVPRGSEGKPAPLVIIPHGGPKSVFDVWGFDTETQLLASRGYAVMQVNFRGSGNYGKAFRESGNGQWGAAMQDDLTDATQWALREGIAAPGRICLYGASYGAYAAMMGLAREPALYACGIGNVGIYDLERMYRSERIYRESKHYFDISLGDVDLGAVSPVRLVQAIRAPVLLGAGELDGVAPVGQTRSMHAALKRTGTPVEMVVYDREAHGYYLMENQLDWTRRVLSLLDRTIGAGRPAP